MPYFDPRSLRRSDAERVSGVNVESTWEIRLLGKFELVSPRGESVRIPSRTATSLLAYLAILRFGEAANDQVQSVLWPDSDGDKQAQSLRRSIADLRKVLEAGRPLGSVVVTRKGHVSLNPDRITIDVDRFLQLAEPSVQDQARLVEAIDLYAGPLLPHLSNDWTMGPRMELEELYGQAVEKVCALLVEQGNAKEAIRLGRAAVVAAPSREDVHLALIRAYGSAGMGVEALRQYEELERTLDDTWGELPSSRVREALETALKQSQPRRHNLTPQLTSFIGRTTEIEEVTELLSKSRLVTLTGSGGCGKTRLALEVARLAIDRYRHGVWFVELAALTDPDLIPQAIAHVLGCSEQGGTPIREVVVNNLRIKDTLLVLDNCEHLLQASSQLASDLLVECPELSLLVSSREALRIPGELAYRVPSLAVPDRSAQTPESLVGVESVRLFVDRASQVKPFVITQENAPVIGSVCRRLDGVPLAIELAAARMRNMSVKEVSERLTERFSLLTGGSRTAMPRQQTLRSLIDWSYDLLTEPEAALFRRLSVFAGGWTLAAAECVCAGSPVADEDLLDLHDSLWDKSLLVTQQQGNVTRYGMLETIRYYARDRLLETGEAASWRDRHLEFFLKMALEAEPHLRGPDQVRWLNALESDYENLTLAIEWSMSSTLDDLSGLRLASSLGQLWERRGLMSEGRKWLAALLSARPAAEISTPRAKAISVAARLAQIQSDQEEARALSQESIRLQRLLDDQIGLAESLNTLGAATMEMGDPRGAIEVFDESLTLRRQVDDRLGIAQSINNLAVACFYLDDLSTARKYAEEALIIRRQEGDLLGIAVNLNLLGSAALGLGERALASELVAEGLSLNRRIGNQRGAAVSLLHLGEIAYEGGDLQTARPMISESLALLQELGLRFGIGNCLATLGDLDYDEGLYASALSHFLACLTLVKGQKRLDLSVMAYEGIASVLVTVGAAEKAAKLWGAAEAIRDQTGIAMKPFEQARHARIVDSARRVYEDDRAFDIAWQEGRTLTQEQAIALAQSAATESI